MDYIVLGTVNPNAKRNARLVALRNYLKRDPAACGVATTQELWASHPDYFMVISASAETESQIWQELAPWHDVCQFKVIPVRPMRQIVEMHLSTPAAITGNDSPAVPAHSPTSPITSVDPPNPLKELLKSVIETDNKNAPWPEDNYDPLSEQMGAYLSIVEQLGNIEPKSGTLPSNAMERVHRPLYIPVDPWNEVYDHLVDELGSFEKVENWFGDKGHMKEFINHMNAANTETLQEIEQQTAVLAALGLSSSQSLTMTLEVMLDALAIAVSVVNVEFTGLSIFLELAGEFLTKSPGGTSFTMNFGTVAAAVEAQFERVDSLIEESRIRLRSNWGRLSVFGFMVTSGQLKWPDDTSKMRDSAKRAFEVYLWQVVLPSLNNLYHWEYATYSQEIISGPPFNPSTDSYAYSNSYPATYQSGGCGSHAIQGFRNVTHKFGASWYSIDNPYNLHFTPLPNEFMYRLFGTVPGDGVPYPLGIDPADFFAGDDDLSNPFYNPGNPWLRIQLMRVGWQS